MRTSYFRFFLVLSDLVALYVAIVSAVVLRGYLHHIHTQTWPEWIAAHVIIFLPSVVFCLGALYIAGMYDIKTLYERSKVPALIAYSMLAMTAFSVLFFYITSTELTPKLTLFLYIVFSFIYVYALRYVALYFIYRLPKQKGIYLFCESQDAALVKKKVSVLNSDFSPYSLEPKVFIKDDVVLQDSVIVFDEKILSYTLDSNTKTENLVALERIKISNKNIFSYNTFYEYLYKKVDLENFDFHRFILELSEYQETNMHFVFRRGLDIFCGLLVVPVFLLALPVVYVLMAVERRRLTGLDMFSIQSRVGLLGEPIVVYKFRTMLFTDAGAFILGSGKEGSSNKYENRVTRLGWFLRKSRIDELPQCLNLLKGNVSMIGPRANILGFHTEMRKAIQYHDLRLLCAQGLTGWAQTLQSIQPRTIEDTIEKFAYEMYYIKNRSVLLDVAIIFKTIKTLLSRTGA